MGVAEATPSSEPTVGPSEEDRIARRHPVRTLPGPTSAQGAYHSPRVGGNCGRKPGGMLTYRQGDPSGIPVYAQFWHDMLIESTAAGSGYLADWRERLELDFTEQMAAGTMAWFVAEDAGHIVGTAAAILSNGRSNVLRDITATLAGIYVVPGHRRRGIARELTERAIAWCTERGCARIRLQASQAGRALYESLGFRTFSEMMKLDLPHDDKRGG